MSWSLIVISHSSVQVKYFIPPVVSFYPLKFTYSSFLFSANRFLPSLNPFSCRPVIYSLSLLVLALLVLCCFIQNKYSVQTLPLVNVNSTTRTCMLLVFWFILSIFVKRRYTSFCTFSTGWTIWKFVKTRNTTFGLAKVRGNTIKS